MLKAFEVLLWALSDRQKGVRALQVLGLSPTSGILGTFRLALSKNAKPIDRIAAVARMGFAAAIWVSGVLLFARTQLMTVYKSVQTYNVTAGVGQFNGSYVAPYLQQFQTTNPGYEYTVLPYSTIVTASGLVVNPMHSTAISPVTCDKGRTCHGYLISGGLIMTTPWPPTNWTSYPVVTIQKVPAIQIDFINGLYNDSFVDSEDCTVFGADEFLIGMKFCLANSRSSPGSVIAGKYRTHTTEMLLTEGSTVGLIVCTQGVQGSECLTDAKPPELTTTFSLYRRHASITTSRSNLSVLSVEEVDAPIQDMHIDIDGLMEAFAWLFNFSSAGIPAPSSIAEYFWTVRGQLESPYWSVEPYQIFQSILAFPFWQFNANNFGNTQLNAQDIVDGLPPDFYTTASVATRYDKIVVNR